MKRPEQIEPRGSLLEIFKAGLVPLLLVLVMWVVHLASIEFDFRVAPFGVKPRTLEGLLGIFTMPFVHGGYEHLMNNSLPMLVLGWALFKFYREIAWPSLIGIWLIGAFWLWVSGREAYHIGASGVVYGLASFLFLSGWLRKEKSVMALSLVIVFVYGGLWWGVLPVKPEMSWEGHLWGALAGFAMAWYFRKKGPQRSLYQWEVEELREKEREKLYPHIVFQQIMPTSLQGDGEEISTPPGTPTNKKAPKQMSGAKYLNPWKVKYTYKAGKDQKNKDQGTSSE